ncbi:rhodanese-related sulfurtransferase, partial [Pseudomonas syringae pv. tagetis]
QRLHALGYSNLKLLEGGLQGRPDARGQQYIDVKVPSKPYRELVDHQRATPTLEAEHIKALLNINSDLNILDARLIDEYHTINIPVVNIEPA